MCPTWQSMEVVASTNEVEVTCSRVPGIWLTAHDSQHMGSGGAHMQQDIACNCRDMLDKGAPATAGGSTGLQNCFSAGLGASQGLTHLCRSSGAWLQSKHRTNGFGTTYSALTSACLASHCLAGCLNLSWEKGLIASSSAQC